MWWEKANRMTSFILQIGAAAKAGDVKLEKLILNIILWRKKEKGLGLGSILFKTICEYEDEFKKLVFYLELLMSSVWVFRHTITSI